MGSSADYENRTNLRRAKRKKKQKRSWVVKAVAGVVLIYLLLLVIFSFHDRVTTVIALNGIIREEISTDGYVFRDQSVILAPVDGYLECLVDDGERVKEGQTLGWIYTGEYDVERVRKMQTLNERIARLESDAASNTYAGNSVMAEQKIGQAARELSDLRGEHDLRNIAEQKNRINLLIEKKRAMDGDAAEDPAAVAAQLKKELRALETETGGGKAMLVADRAGVFCANIDGMEEKLSADAAEELTVSYLENLDQEELVHPEAIVQNEPICKIVDNYKWSYGAVIKAKDAENLQIGKEIRMRFFELSDVVIYGTVRYLSPEEDGKVAVVISTNRYVDGIYGISRASAELITVSAEGIKVPVESLHVQEEQTGVYVLRLGVAHFVPAEVRYKNDDWAVISPVTDSGSEYKLQIYDEVIVEAKNLEDGKVVR